jgi:hypothetical protein
MAEAAGHWPSLSHLVLSAATVSAIQPPGAISMIDFRFIDHRCRLRNRLILSQRDWN